jgi:hypothetical protein
VDKDAGDVAGRGMMQFAAKGRQQGSCCCMMAKVLHKDTGELVGHLLDLRGPVPPWTKDWTFRAWRHADGKLRSYPDPMRDSTPSEVRLAVRNSPTGEMEVLVPTEYLDFMKNHTGLRV